ncbi:MAG: type I restriction enzyme HsdR N-terminal domain-containing protein [Bacteroidales bacterium]|nr:type I restriction enzyme HsdR N-terminal domain-containing protein [Bacteroidales bacterium]
MDLKDYIYQIVSRWDKTKESLTTEEATKNALIMPFIMALGYDIFNPNEVLPEMTCDIGTKKGERIDYAIIQNGDPVILIECKQWEQNLNLHDNQLLRYFTVSKAKFGILTNGLQYRFYTDLIKPNIMDEKPFLEIDLRKIKDTQIEELKKFHKSNFNIDNILSSASELKYMGQLKEVFAKEFEDPSPELIKYFGKQVYDGVFTPKIAEQFNTLFKRAIASYISEQVSNRLNAALKQNDVESAETQPEAEAAKQEDNCDNDSRIITTQEEIDAFNIIRAMLRKDVAVEKITMRDAISYCAILFDDNNRKPICRLHFNNTNNLRIGILNEDGKEERFAISNVDEVYNYEEKLRAIVKRYI